MSPLRLLGSTNRSSCALKAALPRSYDEPIEEFYGMFKSEEEAKLSAVLQGCLQYMYTGSDDLPRRVPGPLWCLIKAAPSTGNTAYWRTTPLQSLFDYAETKHLQQITLKNSFNSKTKTVFFNVLFLTSY